jgi:hypothetical protein
MPHRTIKQMSEITITLYKSEFRGKKKGRFSLDREQIKEVSGRDTLQDTIIKKLIGKLYEQGYSMTCVEFKVIKGDVEFGLLYSIIKLRIPRNYRKPTKAALSKAINEYEDWD